MASAKATTNHDEIRKWVEARGGFPAHVKETGGGNDLGVLRIDYPGFSGQDTLERIEWDDWFDAFDRNNLAFLYQGGRSRFSKLVDRKTVRSSSKESSKGAKATSKKGASSKKASASRKRTSGTSQPAKRGGGAKRSSSAKRTGTSQPAKRASAKRSAPPAKRGGAKRASASRTSAKRK